MSQPDAPDAPSSPATTEPGDLLHRLPRRTTPTWEIELLISAAFAFASLQLPGAIDSLMSSVSAQASTGALSWIGMAFVFGKVSAYVLIATFLLHIFLRGLWTAAVGLNSVFPDGILWDRLKIGPQLRRVYRERELSLARSAEQLDDAASLIFAVGSLLLIFMVISGVMVALMALATFLVGKIAWFAPYQRVVGMGLLFLIALLPAAATMLDRRFGASWPEDSRRARWTRGVLRGGNRLAGNFVVAPFLLTLTSRVGSVRGVLGLMALIYAAMGVVFVQRVTQFEELPWSGVADLPHAGALFHDASHYADERSTEARTRLLPYLATSVATGDWLDLYLPYHPSRMDAFVAARCPAAARPPDDAADSDNPAAAAAVARADEVIDDSPAAATPTASSANRRVDPMKLLDQRVREAQVRSAAKAAAEARSRRAPDGPDAALDVERIRRTILIGCLSGISTPRLDGTKLPVEGFRFAKDPATGLYGLRYRIATYDLARGPHSVTLDWPARIADGEKLPALEPIEIEFWR